jgi:AraC-like DNA-binding protein
MENQRAERKSQERVQQCYRFEVRMRENREELVEHIAHALPQDGVLDSFPGFRLARSSEPTPPVSSMFRPALCLVAQGCKQVLLGDEVFRYDPGHYLIYTVELPLTFQVVEATPKRPYLGIRLDLDPAIVASVVLEADLEPGKGAAHMTAVDVSPVEEGLLDAVVRLVRLVGKPAEQKVLAPLITREIIFRLLEGGQGARLGHLPALGREARRISKAIERLRATFNQPLRVEDLAHDLGMSVSGFHHHFKAVTLMSPLQFQKQIRLQEARRLMISEGLDAAIAGFRVGYEDPAYFSRDYKKRFGAPPLRDIARLRATVTTAD